MHIYQLIWGRVLVCVPTISALLPADDLDQMYSVGQKVQHT